MLKLLVTRGPEGGRQPRRDRHNRRLACHLNVEPLEGRLLLSGDMVLRWVDALVAAERIAGQFGANPASRTGAIVQTAVYEAVNSIDGTHTPYLINIPAPAFAGDDASTAEQAAAAEAAHDALVGLFPTQAPIWNLELKASLQDIGDGDPKSWGIKIGHAAAQIMLAVRAHDGASKVVNYIPGTNPGDWQPTPPAYGPPAQPQWPQVTPFCLQRGSQFRSPPPPALTSQEYTDAFNQVKDLGSFDSTTRTADQTEAAMFWQGIVIPVNAMWEQIARGVALTQGNTLVQNARMFALLTLTEADTGIACWDSKYTYNFWRPVTAIRAADTDGNPNTEADPNWTPLLNTSSHPSYPSAHATLSGGSAALLASYFGTDAIPFSFSWDGLPGVTRSYAGFTAAGDEAAMSRIWAGFHWSFDLTAGRALGQAVAGYIFQNFLLPVTSPPAGGGGAAILLMTGSVTAGSHRDRLSLWADTVGASLPAGQQNVYPVPADAASSPVVFDIRTAAASRARSEATRSQTHDKSVDVVFSSADSWAERMVL